MSLEQAVAEAVAGYDTEDALAALAAVRARLQVQLLRVHANYSRTPKRLLRAPEVAELLRISEKTVYERKHELGAVRVGKRAVRFDAEAVRRVAEDGW